LLFHGLRAHMMRPQRGACEDGAEEQEEEAAAYEKE
jgi:hypothetical protein